MGLFDQWARAAMVSYARRRLDKVEKEIRIEKTHLAWLCQSLGPKAQKAKLGLMKQIEAEAQNMRHSNARHFHLCRASQAKEDLDLTKKKWREAVTTLAKPYGRMIRNRTQLRKILTAAQKLGS